jgi:hypothetical protein
MSMPVVFGHFDKMGQVGAGAVTTVAAAVVWAVWEFGDAGAGAAQ